MAKWDHAREAHPSHALAMSWGTAARAVQPRHEGTVLGLLVAAAIWLWLALVDALLGTPFHTVEALGGVAVFTVAHVALCLLYGKIVAGLMHAAERAPSVIMAMVFGAVLFQTACAMGTVVLAHLALPDLAWVRLFGGSVVGSIVTVAWLHEAHPLGEVLHASEAEH
jgi:hypothetical protein